MMPLAGKPLLVRMLERLQAARTPAQIIVATTTASSDNPVEDLARQAGVGSRARPPHGPPRPAHRGPAHHRLRRGLQDPLGPAAPRPGAGQSDLGTFLEDPSYDYVSNLHPSTWPDGYDVEVMKREVLEAAWREATKPLEREHTTPFIWEQPQRFS